MLKRIIGAVFVCMLGATASMAQQHSAGNFVPAEKLLKSDQVRAEIVKDESQLLGGPKREGIIGDFKLYNDKVGFIIAGTRMQTGVFMYGGIVEEAGLLKPEEGGARWYNLMGDTSLAVYKGGDPLLGSRMLAPVKAEILKDGSDGEAIVRILARDAEWPERKEATTMKSSSLKIRAMIDYILKPGTQVLEIKVTLLNDKKKSQLITVGQFFLMGDGSQLFAPGHGFDITAADGMEFPIFTSVGSGVAYGWFPESGLMQVNQQLNRRLITTFGQIKVEPEQEGSFSFYLAVSDSGASSVSKVMYDFKGENNYGTVGGECLTTGSGVPPADTAIVALTPDGKMFANTDVNADTGAFELALPPGEYDLQAASYDRTAPAPIRVSVEAGKTTDQSIEIDPPATFEYKVTDETGKIIPAVISFKLKGESKGALANDFYYNLITNYSAGFFKIHFAGLEAGSIDIRPGAYDVYVSRGLEYEYEITSINIKAGEVTSKEFSIAHVVDTTGYLSADFHVHSQPSNDVNDLVYIKVRAAAGLGLEVPVATDHDVATDYKPYINELGLQDVVTSIIGDELTTIRLGHFNAYPLTFDPSKKNYGAPIWFEKSVPEFQQEFRDDPKDNTIIQINHPRSKNSGYFNIIGYNHDTATAAIADQFTLNFDSMELLNGTGYSEMDDSLPDWYSFLNRGKPVVGLGNSDNHSTYNLGLGYPRNYVASATDVPGEMIEDDFIASVRGQHVSVCGGAFVTADINGDKRPGDLLSPAKGVLKLNVKVQAPSWVEVKTLRVIEGGKEIETVSLSGGEIVRYEGTFDLKPAADTWYVVIVEGDKKLFPVYPGARPFSVTNPIYVDVDGNGKYDAPLSFTKELLSTTPEFSTID